MKRIKSHPLVAITLKTLWRRKGSSIILTVVMLVAVLANIILYGLQIRQEAAISEMVANTQIRCTVTNAKGSDVDDLGVGSFYVDMLVGLRHSRDCFLDEYVKDVRAFAREKLAVPAGASVCRIYSRDSDPDLQAINGGSVSFYDDWSEDCLTGSEFVCLVTEDLLPEAHSDSDGKTYITITRQGGTDTTLQIVGTVAGSMSRQIYCPFYTSLLYGESEAFDLVSCSFTIKDNRILEESKQALYSYFVYPSSVAANDYMTAGLLVHDEIYLQSLSKLESNLATLRVLLPALIIITGCVGFLSAYLTNRGRKKELAVMRCMGIKWRRVFLQVFLEQGLLAVFGCAMGMLLAVLLRETFSAGTWGQIAVLLTVDLLGAAIAALQISSVNVMKLMKVED